MNKKGVAVSVLVLTIIIVAAIFYWVGSVASRECNNNNDCNSNEYCGSDFRCHEMTSNSGGGYFWPAFFLGVSIIAAALILRWRRGKPV